MNAIQILIQTALDRFMDLGPFSHLGGGRIPKGKIGAYCPECWKPYRSAAWIAKQRVQRHAKRVHGIRLALKKIPTEREKRPSPRAAPKRIRKPAKVSKPAAAEPAPTPEPTPSGS